MRNASPGRAVFALTLIGLGLLGLVEGGFSPIWQGVPKGFPARELLAYLCALISLGCGVGLLVPRVAALASRVLLGYLLIWTLIFKGRFIVLEPLSEGTYQSCGENVVLVAGAWVLYASLASGRHWQQLGFLAGEAGVRIARVLYALAMIAFGFSHFVYLNLTAPLVPGWLPWHVGWAYFTGAAYLAAGAAMLIGVFARLAAALSAVQMGLLTFLVWVPLVAARGDASQWSEFILSWALAAAAWVLVDSYRGAPWLAVGRR